MKRRRVVLGAAGVVLLGLALLGSGDGPLADLVDAAVTALGNDYLFLVAIAAGGLVVASAMVVSGRSGNLRQARMPDPERPVAVPTPGAGFDDRIGSVRFGLPVVGDSTRESVRERLRTSAVDVTMRSEGCSREEAERMVADGRWTDDPDAAAFLSGSNPASFPELLGAGLRGETPSQRRARRTAEEIVARAPGARGDG
ncbi:hypothetical protein HUG10_19185 (plasmid) [Halorarum halophilum]|uniref:Uncharacterized protein n=1 Tax=Halorarum halophilum TaxID=2743090 RepID=A0A7D5GKF1_9EURY|nr:hypothetical protein [Halobaculum halophilum]QLG29731.1 hypothetical protein HUG10_19185 [Halobaculum halophilum]